MHRIALFVLLSPVLAFARLGETPAEIAARYGASLEDSPGPDARCTRSVHHFGGFRIFVAFLDGRSAFEAMIKTGPEAITDEEVQALLAANAGGAEWKLARGDGNLVEWESAPDRLATLLRSQRSLSIKTRAYLAYDEAAKAQASKARLKGF